MRTLRTGLFLLIVGIILSTIFEESTAECEHPGPRQTTNEVGPGPDTNFPIRRPVLWPDLNPGANRRSNNNQFTASHPFIESKSPPPITPIYFKPRNGIPPTNLLPPLDQSKPAQQGPVPPSNLVGPESIGPVPLREPILRPNLNPGANKRNINNPLIASHPFIGNKSPPSSKPIDLYPRNDILPTHLEPSPGQNRSANCCHGQHGTVPPSNLEGPEPIGPVPLREPILRPNLNPGANKRNINSPLIASHPFIGIKSPPSRKPIDFYPRNDLPLINQAPSPLWPDLNPGANKRNIIGPMTASHPFIGNKSPSSMKPIEYYPCNYMPPTHLEPSPGQRNTANCCHGQHWPIKPTNVAGPEPTANVDIRRPIWWPDHNSAANNRNNIGPVATSHPLITNKPPQSIKPLEYYPRNDIPPSNLPPPPFLHPMPPIREDDVSKLCSTCEPETYATHIYHINNFHHHHYYNASTSNDDSKELIKPKLN